MEPTDLACYQPHLAIDDIDLDGVAVPGLRAEFLRRADGDRVATVGRYSLAGRELLRVWGYVGEEHCRYFAVLGADGAWERPQSGCPRVRVLTGEHGVIGLALRSATGDWLVRLGAVSSISPVSPVSPPAPRSRAPGPVLPRARRAAPP